MGDKRGQGQEAEKMAAWIHNVSTLLDEIEGGVRTGQEGGKVHHKHKITTIHILSNQGWIYPLSLKYTTSKIVHLKQIPS